MKFSLVFLSVFFTYMVTAQTRDSIDLWPDVVPNETKPKQAARVNDNESDDVIRLTEVTNPILTIFKPDRPNTSNAGIIVCPGGGYNILAINKEGHEIAEWLNSLGYTAFVLEYRIPKNRAGAVQDVQRAVRWVRSQSTFYNIDAQKIGVMGFSAGGHLSATASINFEKSTYSNIDGIDDFPCRPNFAMLIYPAYLDQGENRSLSPELTITENTPPFFVFGTADDKYGNSALVITTALRDNRVPVDAHMLAKGGHGYGLRKGNMAAETWPVLAEKWMDRMLNSREIAKYQRKLNFSKDEEIPNKLPNKKDVWVFLMAGQSNMAGRAFVEPQDTIPNTRILTINKNNDIILAKEPLHFYEPNAGGLDCGMSFAQNLLNNIPEDVSILLIPTAIGGSSMNQWVNDSLHRDVKLLSNFKQKMALAKKYGQIKGVLWHQGESDANKRNIPQYDKNLTKLFKVFRSLAGNEKLPILIGELGGYRAESASWIAINNIINTHANKDEYMSVINTSDFNHKGDNLHFDSESQRLFGKRFAEVYVKSVIDNKEN